MSWNKLKKTIKGQNSGINNKIEGFFLHKIVILSAGIVMSLTKLELECLL